MGGTVAAGAGIGGGGIFVPVLILLAGFESKDGIPLSNVFFWLVDGVGDDWRGCIGELSSIGAETSSECE